MSLPKRDWSHDENFWWTCFLQMFSEVGMCAAADLKVDDNLIIDNPVIPEDVIATRRHIFRANRDQVIAGETLTKLHDAYGTTTDIVVKYQEAFGDRIITVMDERTVKPLKVNVVLMDSDNKVSLNVIKVFRDSKGDYQTSIKRLNV